MKKKNDPRHEQRIRAVQTLFSNIFKDQVIENGSLAQQIKNHQEKIDKLIKKNAPAWPINQISPIDLATLRLAIWELKFAKKKEPYKVIIDEAVEIAKEFGNDASPSFINGVLGTILKTEVKK